MYHINRLLDIINDINYDALTPEPRNYGVEGQTRGNHEQA